MTRATRKLAISAVCLAGFLMLLGGIALDVIMNRHKPALVLSSVGVLVILMCCRISASLARRRYRFPEQADE